MKTLIVVSGGDAPGINTCIARFTKMAARYGHRTIGANGGFAGVLSESFIDLQPKQVYPFANQGGTLIASSREPVLATQQGQIIFQEMIEKHKIDNLLLFGGNGTLHNIPPILQSLGISFVAIPTTIDNDVPSTKRTLGFDSACNFAYRVIDGIHLTAQALPGRIFLVETLGGDTGYLALAIAKGARANAVLIPEYTYDEKSLGNQLQLGIEEDGYALLVLSEGITDKGNLGEVIFTHTGILTRYTQLGHGQRATTPSHIDRAFAIDCADIALDALHTRSESGIILIPDDQLIFHEGILPDIKREPPDLVTYHTINGFDSL